MAGRQKPISEQVIVVTGASSGIGLATALAAADAGAKLVLNARSEHALRAVADQVHELGGEAEIVVGDVADRSTLECLARSALERYGRIDTWINNAGVSIYGRIRDIPEPDSRRLFETNFWAVVNGSLVALPHLERSGGTLINVGSEVSDAIVPLQGMYAASKHAVKGFTDALRLELQHEDSPVHVTLIQPGATNTPFPQHARNYMEREPALPPPLDEPFDVAGAILRAATSDERAVLVSASAKLNSILARYAPALGERLAERQFERQQYEEPPRDPAGALFAPGGEGRLHGTGGARPREHTSDSRKHSR